jgi:hypothetical protein
MLIAILVLLLIILIILAVLIWLLLRLRILGGSPSVPGPAPPSIPDALSEVDVGTLLAVRLAGTLADGSAQSGPAPTSVIWVDQGDEVLVHLDSVAVRYVGQTMLVSIDLESDQTGRTPLVVPFALGDDSTAGATLLAATEEFPRGNALLAARWGAPVRDAAWSAMLQLATDHATERGAAPLGLTLQSGALRLSAGAALTMA